MPIRDEQRIHGRARERGDYAGRLRRLAEEVGRSYATGLKRAHIATTADLYQVALGIIVANAAIMFGLLKLVP